jgi:hypothetical protein
MFQRIVLLAGFPQGLSDTYDQRIMNAVFTIVAKNYLPQARTLGDSIRRIHPDLPFYILLADETEGLLDLTKEQHPVIEVKDIGIVGYRDMAFKYSLVEFSTGIKPFVFEHLFERFQFEKIIYLDPDTFVYSSLDPIFDSLDSHFMILTPHITKLSLTDDGTKSENDFLINGTYNLGFVALHHRDAARTVLRWWSARLKDKGYIDRLDGLFTDQKWMNLLPCFVDQGVLISRNPGYNLAHWNMHERELSFSNGQYLVDGCPLVFFHFSGFDPHKPDRAAKSADATKSDLQNKPEWRQLFIDYADNLLSNQTEEAAHSYVYGVFNNRVKIFAFQRRLYRRLIESGFHFEDPFSTDQGSFYDLLQKNRMVIYEQIVAGEYTKKDFAGAETKLKALTSGMILLKKVVGIKYFHLLSRILSVLCQPEEQVYLLETLHGNLPIRFGRIPE